jgi:hypothetical protein
MSEPDDLDPLAELSKIVFNMPPDAAFEDILQGAIRAFESGGAIAPPIVSLDDILADELEYTLGEHAETSVREEPEHDSSVQITPPPTGRLPRYDQIICLIHLDIAIDEHRTEMRKKFGAHRLL